MKNIALKLIGFLVLAYGTVVAGVVVMQRSLIYSPVAEGPHTPREYGAAFEDVVLPSSSGPALKGWFVHNSERIVSEPRPILVYCQGNGGALSARAKVAALFDSIGVDTIMMSYRGYGNSGFGEITPTEAHIYEDAQQAYDFARARVPEHKIIVWGHSLGAAVAAHLAVTNRPAGLILESPFTRIAAMVPVRYPWLIVPSFLIWDTFPTQDYVQQLRTPLLVLVAQQDTVIPPSFGAQVFASASEPKTFVPLDGINHNELPDAFERFRKPISEFIAASLTQGAPHS